MQFNKHIAITGGADYQQTISHLKMHDTHFAKLFDSYHALESQVFNIEKDKSLVKDVFIKSLKKRRDYYKNELFDIIQKAERAVSSKSFISAMKSLYITET
jgi:uncharacterized protein YdcH (DUF465 family)